MPPPAVPFVYRVLSLALCGPIACYTVGRTLREGGTDYLRQRYARGLPQDLGGRIGIHCCSVGEVNTAVPLIEALEADGYDSFLSVTTPSARQIAQRRLPNLPCVYFPLDHARIVRRWLRRMRPRAMLIMETELWPHFFHAAHRDSIPLALINARLSEKTLHPPALLRPALHQTLQRVHCILARSHMDAEKFLAQSAPVSRVEEIGNLKYTAAPTTVEVQRPIPQPYVLAVSTHDDEERQLAEIWQGLEGSHPLLALLPRHPQRAGKILDLLQAMNLPASRHSQANTPQAEDAVYVIDTLGEASWWMKHAGFVFMGGSLIPHGGHNVLEAAALGQACIVGPHIENFRQEAEALLNAGGLCQIDTRKALASVFSDWLEHPAEAARIGVAAVTHMQSFESLTERYIDALRRYNVLPA